MVQFSGAESSYQETVIGKFSHNTLGVVFWVDGQDSSGF